MKTYIIEFKDNFSKDESKRKDVIKKQNATYKGSLLKGKHILIETDEATIEKIKKSSEIKNIHENKLYENPWDAQTIDYPINVMHLQTSMHSYGYKGDDVPVGIVDTGINYDHEDIPPVYKGAWVWDGVVQSENNPTDYTDNFFHGSRTAGVLFMQDNDKGYLGVVPNSKPIVAKITSGTTGDTTSATIAKAIEWCVDKGARVVSFSFDFNSYDAVVDDAFEYAFVRGVPVVAGVGNNGALADSSFPLGDLTATERVSMAKVFTGSIMAGGVESASTPYGVQRYASSSWGQGVDFVAPARVNTTVYNNNTGYIFTSGTSFSTPWIAGIIALIIQRFPRATWEEIYNILVKNCVTVGAGEVKYYGNGMPVLSAFQGKTKLITRSRFR